MNSLSLFLFLIFFTSLSFGTANYIESDGGFGRVRQALESVYGTGAGVGIKNNSCLLCHSRSSGGPGNINPYFGRDFRNASLRLGFGQGSQLPPTGVMSLADIFEDAQFAALDSDGDGRDNETEFLANTDPADNVQSGETGGSGGGGCGLITTPPTSGGGLFLIVLPVLLLLILRSKRSLNWSN